MTDTSMHRVVYWVGKPDPCDMCGAPPQVTFYDARTKRGPWASMCPHCFNKHGVGLGTGNGQRYDYQRDLDKWMRVDG